MKIIRWKQNRQEDARSFYRGAPSRYFVDRRTLLRRNLFLFPQDERIGQAVSLFYTNRAKVEPRGFLQVMRDLKKGV